MRKIFLIYLLFNLSLFYGQDLNCEITIDARQTGQENLQVFKSLENQLNEFINNNSWSGRSVRPNEKINCAMFLNISSMDNDSFNGTLQIQASRPVYNSSYSSPVYNFNDKNLTGSVVKDFQGTSLLDGRLDIKPYAGVEYSGGDFGPTYGIKVSTNFKKGGLLDKKRG